ncbi:hypothetical protein HK104_000100 [Borealophlyctis nickersoniae]|nr:hypothetical protein HK104_000100 [Borealophlyctis nickersoniae]
MAITIRHIPAHKSLVYRIRVKDSDFGAAARSAFAQIEGFIAKHSLQSHLVKEAPESICHCPNAPSDKVAYYESGLLIADETPVTDALVAETGIVPVAGSDMGEGLAVRAVEEGEWAVTVHTGSYSGIGAAFLQAWDELEKMGRKFDGKRIPEERYMNDCHKVKVEELVTELMVPVQSA